MKPAFRRLTLGSATAVLAVSLAACSSSSSSSSTTSGNSSGPTTTVAIPTTVIPTQATNAAIAATVPASIKSSGQLTVALDATYAPDEFVAPSSTQIIGMDVDLSKAIAQTLGLKPVLINATFDTIIPGINSGKYDLGASSFTDTLARQKVVDFVDYFQAGEGFYVKTGSGNSFNGLDSLCGHTVSVESGTTEQSDAVAQAKKCKSEGKSTVTVLAFDNQNQANLAVSSGRAQVGFADSQIAAYIVATSGGVFSNSGSAFAVAPYGLATNKGNGLATPVAAAVNALIKNGVYNQILTKWGVQSGAVTTATINGATS